MGEDFMEAAVEAARQGVARCDGGPFGAVVVRQGEIVARAWNRVLRDQDPTAHAEVNAIREACRLLGRFHLEDCELYTSCEPCPMCLGAIYWARLGGVYFAASRSDAAGVGFDDARIYEEMARAPEARQIRFVKVACARALEVMCAWQAAADRHLY